MIKNLSKGDKVRFLNEVGGGTVSKITASGMVHVMDDDGFEIPVRATDIVVVGRDEYADTSSAISLKDELSARNSVVEKVKPVVVQPVADVIDSDDYELLLAFVPEDQSNPTDCNLNLYFINDSSFYCSYIVSYRTKTGAMKLLGQNTVAPDTKEFLCAVDKVDFNSKLNLSIAAFMFKHKEYRHYPPEQVNVDLNPLKFVKKNVFTENDFFDEKAYILKIAVSSVPETKMEIAIDPQELEKAIKQKDPVTPTTETAPKRKSDVVEEIDLHIEALLDDTRGLDNGQILEIQKARFVIALESGFTAKTKKMEFIHGVGNGKLKHEIRRLLDTQYVGLVRYYDASFQEYGFGATMVILR
jgi:hypothetical protein